MQNKGSSRIVVTVVGKDKVGIIAGVANVLAEYNANILDISQTILQEFFTMIMIVDIGQCTVDFNVLKEKLITKGEEIGVKISAQHEDVFQFMHRI
ncbi:MAG: ACT domain-containing protein [Clostridia bacterium]|nr:ACT domain-containing protein [Clostridia bacterium]